MAHILHALVIQIQHINTVILVVLSYM